MEKNSEQEQAIRERWRHRCLLRQIEQLLPVGYVVKNKKPVQKQVRRVDSLGCTVYWSSWCKDPAGETYLALLDAEKHRLKLIPEQIIKTEYYIRSI